MSGELKHKEYCIVLITKKSVEKQETDTFEKAKEEVKRIYALWKAEECKNWLDIKGIPSPSIAQIIDFNMMICNNKCYIVKWDEEKNDYEDIVNGFFFSQEELETLGWITWAELREKYGW